MGNCKLKKWTSNNKLLAFFAATTISLFVSTVALAAIDRSCTQLLDHVISEKFNASSKGTTIPKDKNYYRLPKNIEPINYRLLLNPNMIDKSFIGSVLIAIRVLRPTSKILLHSKNLSIHSVNLKDNINGNVPIKSYNITVDKRELLMINLESDMKNELYTLFILFSGRLHKKIVGLYSSQLKNGGAREKPQVEKYKLLRNINIKSDKNSQFKLQIH